MRWTYWQACLLVSVAAHALLALAMSVLPPLSADAPASDSDLILGRDFDVTITDVYDADPFERTVPISSVPVAVPTIEGKEPGTLAGSIEESSGPPAQATGPAAGGSPAAPVPAVAPLFPVSGVAKSVVYVIDRSGSMGEAGRLQLARRELAASLRRLPETTRFQVIAYNRFPEVMRIAGRLDLANATEDHIAEALRQFDELSPEGGTEHLAALRQALLLRPEVVFFLTDADDLRLGDVALLTQLNLGQTAIHVVELTLANRDREDMPMHVLARGNRGTYRAVDTDR